MGTREQAANEQRSKGSTTMAKAYSEEIVYTDTADGLTLEGVVIRPTTTPSRSLPVIWVHGLTGRFYAKSSMLSGRDLAAEGYTFVSGNNRGHDFGARVMRKNGEAMLAGGGWERFDESPHDVEAWIAFAGSIGFERVVLIGHSLGGLKVAYYQALRQDPRVAGLVSASSAIRAGRVDPDLLKLAERMEAEGKKQDLLP